MAGDEHNGCTASHRHITCAIDPTLATTDLLAYYLLSEDGLEKVGLASLGSADRNRTLSLVRLGKNEVLTSEQATHQTFNSLQIDVAALKAKHVAIPQAHAPLLPATLGRLFARSG